ncbi:NADH:flavin oxidoreductase/NADH oxidase [Pseudorhodoplanes sp.]|uniref:NADH:flavin oxidoreductase/NADH oxidase n=1 Tax=Pseudorhodoplanes sp. TaxID=1934341 RepID=UPI002BF2DCD1|nr:NADH:flavin oxidoreductase/NADH oxidase [Pseudorhodoplanes sp.]HWV43175.1 NADH:flavin oxidoreductase/NADH oxidase [Pseudorhodoplanes sp.]
MTSALFSPITLRGLTLPNRVVVSPMCQYASEDGSATDWHLQHLGSFSLGAAGLVITEMTMVSRVGRISQKCAGLYSDENEKALKRVIDFCKTFGVAKQGVQIGHAGRKGSTQPPAQGGKPLKPEEGAWETLGPSPIPFGEGWPLPREMNKTDLKQVLDEFVSAVQRADRVGYDLVEIHGGHGYLLNQFLSPLANQRSDEYGGSVEKRMRYPLEVFAACREVWPKDKPMGIRVSAVDWVDGGTTVEDTVAFAKELKKLGCDFVDVSSGNVDLRQKVPFAPAFNAPFAERVRREADIPTMVVGLITKAREAEEIVASGKADMIVIGRAAMWDPRWAWHAAEELGAETPYAPKTMPSHPKMRPQVFPNRAATTA